MGVMLEVLAGSLGQESGCECTGITAAAAAELAGGAWKPSVVVARRLMLRTFSKLSELSETAAAFRFLPWATVVADVYGLAALLGS